MADLRKLDQAIPTAPRRRWRPFSDTRGGATLEYALVVFVVSTLVGFVLPHFGISIMALVEQVTAVIDAVVSGIGR